MHTVNLRAVGSDPEFPTRGPLIGTADIEAVSYTHLRCGAATEYVTKN